MITIAPPKPRVQQNLERIEQPIHAIENYMKACVEMLNSAYQIMWTLPDEEIEEIMNFKGPEGMEALLTTHATHATMFNQILSSRGITSPVATIGLPREFTLDAQGVFHLTPLPTPEPEPLPEPEP